MYSLSAGRSVPPPKEGFQRRQLHFEAVGAAAVAGSLWAMDPTPLQVDPARIINLPALDALFAQPVAPAAGAPTAGSGCEAAAAGGIGDRGHVVQGSSCGGGDGAEGGTLSRATSGLSRQSSGVPRRPAVRFIVAGRRSVNLEIIMKKLGPPAQVGVLHRMCMGRALM